MPILKESPSLTEIQQYVADMVTERGFRSTLPEIFMMLLEECGELAKAARKASGRPIDANSQNFDVAEEAADVFLFLLDICNRFNINLESALRTKEQKNATRTWR